MMRNRILNRLIVAAALAGASFLAGCGDTPSHETQEVEIVLSGSATQGGIPMRAAIGANGQTHFRPTIAGWEGTATPDYATAPAWSTTSATDIRYDANSAEVGLAATQYYNTNNAVRTYVKAWYPQGAAGAGRVAFTSAATDGTQDVLYARAVSGSKFSAIAAPLVFRHPLTQIRLQVKRNDNTDQTVYRITLKDARLPSGIDIVNDRMEYHAAADLVIYDDAAGQQITSTEEQLGKTVMTEPFAGKKIWFDILTDVALYENVEATIDADEDFVAGKAYMITLYFEPSPVHARAQIVAWEEGASSNPIID